jgi:hypothetical protein
LRRKYFWSKILSYENKNKFKRDKIMMLSTIAPFIPGTFTYLKVAVLNRGGKVCPLNTSNFCILDK